jgi:hypothetical protein
VNGVDGVNVKWQYLWTDDAESHTVTILPKMYQNAPNAPQTWTFEVDDMLKRTGAEMVTSGDDNSEATLKYKGGWGKVKVTMTSYSQNLKYVANKKTWTITFGQAPKQTYPYTWDFTKFFTSTLGSTTNENTWAAVSYDTGASKPLRVAVYNSHSSSNYGNGGWPVNYNSSDYQSYYVEGAQLVSYGLRNTSNGVLRETEGLGFKLDADNDVKKEPDQNMLLLNMSNTVATAQPAYNGQTWNTVTTGGHTTESHLTIGSGGKVIVPKPNDAVNYGNYYIYIKSSVEPSAYTNVKKMVSDPPADATQLHDDNYDVPEGVYKYRFSANADAEFTFTNNVGDDDSQLAIYSTDVADPTDHRKYVDIYAIAVTKDFKELKRLNDTKGTNKAGWATESRDYAVDYTLDSLLTTRPVWAYSIINRQSNPVYSINKSKTTVRLIDRNYVVPANQGLVLKQVGNSPESETYSVPLFVPAVTTAAEAAFANNLLRPNLIETTFNSETEIINETEYTRFIFSEKYMTWRKEGSTLTQPTAYVSGTVPGFYRLHIYTPAEASSITPSTSADALNTLGANKAYLVLLTDKINTPIWNTSGGAKQGFIGIEGISDMEEITEVSEPSAPSGTYNMQGQKMDDNAPLPAGIYIINGRKVSVTNK